MDTVSGLIRRLLAVLLLVGGAVVLVAAPASACPASNASWSRQVRGRRGLHQDVSRPRAPGASIHYTVQVDRSYKGDVGEEAMVMTPRSTRACGLPDLAEGSAYLFFATDNGGDLAISSQGGYDGRDGRPRRASNGCSVPAPPRSRPDGHATFTLVADEAHEPQPAGRAGRRPRPRRPARPGARAQPPGRRRGLG